MATPSRSEFEDELQADAERVCRPHPANATAAASPETLRDIAKQKSLQGHPFVRLALRNAAAEIERLKKDQHSLRATIRRYRSAAKACGTIVYMAEHPEELEANHEPFV